MNSERNNDGEMVMKPYRLFCSPQHGSDALLGVLRFGEDHQGSSKVCYLRGDARCDEGEALGTNHRCLAAFDLLKVEM